MKRFFILPYFLFFLSCSFFEKENDNGLRILYMNVDYVDHSTKATNLLSMDIDGNYKKSLTGGDSTHEYIIDVSRDGKKIYYRVIRNDKYQLVVMDSNGDNKKVVLSLLLKEYYVVRVFSDENRLLCIKWNEDYSVSEIGIYDIQKKEFISLTQGRTMDYNYNVSMSFDESKIVFYSETPGTHDNDIFMVTSDGNNIKNLTKNIGHVYNPQISPDGQFVIFQNHYSDSHEKGIYVYNISSQSLDMALPNDTCVYFIDPNKIISNNSSQFVFRSHCPNRKSSIGIVNIDGTGKIIFNLGEFEYFPRDPIISSNGEWIVFYPYYGSGIDIYRISSDGTHLKTLTNGGANGDTYVSPFFINE